MKRILTLSIGFMLLLIGWAHGAALEVNVISIQGGMIWECAVSIPAMQK